jgi:hypothetical protein
MAGSLATTKRDRDKVSGCGGGEKGEEVYCLDIQFLFSYIQLTLNQVLVKLVSVGSGGR